MQLSFGVMLNMSATPRVNDMGPSTEPCCALYLAVKKMNNLSLFVQNVVCALDNEKPSVKNLEKFNECIFVSKYISL